MSNNTTTIQIYKSTHDELNGLGKRDETYAQIVSFLMEHYKYISETNKMNRETLERVIKKYREKENSTTE